MPNPIVPKFNGVALSTTPPTALALTTGEIASNLASGRLYLRTLSGVVDVAPVKSVNGQTGQITLNAAAVGALSTAQLGAVNGVAGLGADGKLVSSQLPAITTGNLSTILTTAQTPGLVPQLDGTGKISMAQIPSSLQGALNYQGLWNAATNSPALASAVGSKGHYYIVGTAGSTSLDGINDWLVGDMVIFNQAGAGAGYWDKVSGHNSEVISVNGVAPVAGNVTLTPSNIGAVGTAQINALNGVAGLGGAGKIGTAQLPAATTAAIGAVRVGDNLTVDAQGRLSAVQGVYTLPPATTGSLGGIVAGSGLQIQLNGILSVPVATPSVNGIMRPGTGLVVSGGGVLTPDNNVVITTDSPATVFNGGTY
jgi:hypothetical protein